jgi:hypothetical protein
VHPPLLGETTYTSRKDVPRIQSLVFSSDPNNLMDILSYNVDNKGHIYTNNSYFSVYVRFYGQSIKEAIALPLLGEN